MPIAIDFGLAYKAALGTAYSTDELGENAQDSRSVIIPGKMQLDTTRLLLEIKSGAPTTITWFISEDAAGLRPITDERTDTIKGTLNANYKSVNLAMSQLTYARTQFEVSHKLYMNWKLDAGTADCYGYLLWRTSA
jgi:hypothetical protein